MNQNKPDTQLPAEWVIKIDKEAQDKYPYSIQATERAAYKKVAKEYAIKLQEAQQEIESLKRWKEEANALLDPIFEYGHSKEASIPVGRRVIETVLERCKRYEAIRALLEKIVDRYGITADKEFYNEIKTFLDGAK